ncbi:cold shock domain-containing protein, partial [Alcanivorax sp. HI0003]
MKKQAGVLKQWDDARGFGFITDKKGRDIFVHVSAFEGSRSRPKAGEKVRFRVEP